MKIIELLNKIANGEETPKKFKYDGLTFEENKYGYYVDEDGSNLLASICNDYSNLNDKITIIEEDLPDMRMEDYLKEEIEKLNQVIDTLRLEYKTLKYDYDKSNKALLDIKEYIENSNEFEYEVFSNASGGCLGTELMKGASDILDIVNKVIEGEDK